MRDFAFMRLFCIFYRYYLVMKKISEALDQYTGICKEESFEKVIIEILLLYMVVPGRIN